MDIGVFKLASTALASKLNSISVTLNDLRRTDPEKDYSIAGVIVRPSLPGVEDMALRLNPPQLYFYIALRGRDKRIYVMHFDVDISINPEEDAPRRFPTISTALMAPDLEITFTIPPFERRSLSRTEEEAYFDSNKPIDLVYLPLPQVLYCAGIAVEDGQFVVDPDYYGYYPNNTSKPAVADISLAMSFAFTVLDAPNEDGVGTSYQKFTTFKFYPHPEPVLKNNNVNPALAYELGVACPPRWNPAMEYYEINLIDPARYTAMREEFIPLTPELGTYRMSFWKRFQANKLSWPLTIAATLAVGQLALSLFKVNLFGK
jgi:hypothetical protein